MDGGNPKHRSFIALFSVVLLVFATALPAEATRDPVPHLTASDLAALAQANDAFTAAVGRDNPRPRSRRTTTFTATLSASPPVPEAAAPVPILVTLPKSSAKSPRSATVPPVDGPVLR